MPVRARACLHDQWYNARTVRVLRPGRLTRRGTVNPLQIALKRWYEAGQAGAFHGNQAAALTFPVAGAAGVAFDGQCVWVSSSTGLLTKLRASDGAVVGTFKLGAAASRMAFDGAHLWVVTAKGLEKVRARDGAIVGAYSAGGGDVAFDGTYVWSLGVGTNVVRLAARDGSDAGTFAVPLAPRGMVFDGANVWVAQPGSPAPHQEGRVTKLRASDGAILGSYMVGEVTLLAYDGANVWAVTCPSQGSHAGTAWKLRASDGTPLGHFGVGISPSAVAFDGESVWVASGSFYDVVKLRASDGAKLGSFNVGDHPTDIAFDGAFIWVSVSSAVAKL